MVQILRGGLRVAFLTAFWALMTGVAALRTAITVYRLRSIADDTDAGPGRQTLILRLHMGFFCLLALLEVVNSFILLVKLRSASRISTRAALQNKSSTLFRHLMRSTVVRVGILALVGTTRAITSYFSISTQDPNSTASVLDSCAYIAECAFPIFM